MVNKESPLAGMAVPVGRRAALVAGSGLVALGCGLRPVSAAQATPAATSDEAAACATAWVNKALWSQWITLWNGDLAVADAIAAPDFVAHYAPDGGNQAEVHGPEGLRAWVERFLSAFTDARITTSVGPMADGDLLSGRFLFRGAYRGGIPGASPEAVGRPVEYAGIDILRVEDGKLVEHWLSADALVLLRQIGAIPS